MQQTRIAQGTKYYLRFVATYPTVGELAAAPLDHVLKLWEGLGYYSRARNLHAAANQIMNDHNGAFPKTYQELLNIKGIGPYTAAAIASICFGEKKAVVDGNVFRVLSRIYGIDTPINSTAGKKQFQELADKLITQAKEPGDYNQAMMEFGALHCTPKNPLCTDCMFANACVAYQTGKVNALPVKQKAKPLRNRYLHYFLLVEDEQVYIQQRKANDIWSHLYEFPLFESGSPILQPKELKSAAELNNGNVIRASEPIKHILSHQRLHITFWEVDDLPEKFKTLAQRVDISHLKQVAMPIALKRFVDANLLPLRTRLL